MCCFSQQVEHVGATRIFARGTEGGRQMLVYSMDVRAKQPLAMILPLPVPPHPADDAVRFVDLSAYPTFFDDMRKAFPAMMMFSAQAPSAFAPAQRAKPVLVVHKVGAFEASFVPSIADFARLDERFLSPEVWAKLPEYADWGFAVFQLSASPDDTQTVHPMAFEFPRRDPDALFFPTVHVHDGKVHDGALFDHDLYCQADGILGATLDWQRSTGPLGERVEEVRARGVVRADAHGFTWPLHGNFANRDVVLRSSVAWSGGGVVSAQGDCWAVRLHGTHGRMSAETLPPERRGWCETSRRHLDKIFAALRDGVPELVARHKTEWGLTPYPGEIPSFWPSRYPIWHKPGAYLFMGEIFTSRVEHQEVVFSFKEQPTRDTERSIETELRHLLDRALDDKLP